MFLLVPAHPGCPGQNPQSHKMVVCVCSEECLQRNFYLHVCITQAAYRELCCSVVLILAFVVVGDYAYSLTRQLKLVTTRTKVTRDH